MGANRITSARRSKSGRGSVSSRSWATYQQIAIDVGPLDESRAVVWTDVDHFVASVESERERLRTFCGEGRVGG